MKRRERVSGQEADSRDRWLVSYSDFIMLLFALFVVLFASSYRDNRTIPVVSRAIRSGFLEMSAFSSADSEKEGALPNPAETSQHNPRSSATDMLLLQQQLEVAIGRELRNHEVIMRSSPEGFVISLNEIGFFDSGQARLLPGGAEKIHRIAVVLSHWGFSLRIEGHSDNQPIHNGRYQSNWELSTARAMAVLSLLACNSTFDPAKLSVAGYGEYRPVASNATPEGRRLNRRVDLVVVATPRQP